MKKLVRIAAILLIPGILLTLAGILIAKKDSVSSAAIYGMIENTLMHDESLVEYSTPMPTDISAVKDRSSAKEIRYELNEFNSIELYAENISVSFTDTVGDEMSFILDTGKMDTAILGGVLHIQASDSEKNGHLDIGVPETYKGGCVLKGLGSVFTLADYESAMDISVDLSDSSLSAERITADNIDISSGGSKIKIGILEAKDNVKILADSSDYKLTQLASQHSSLIADNCTLLLEKTSGAFSASSQMSSLDISFPRITGNISLDVVKGSANVKLPKDDIINLVNEETYALLTNKTRSAQNEPDDPSAHYTLETNIKFGFVTLENN